MLLNQTAAHGTLREMLVKLSATACFNAKLQQQYYVVTEEGNYNWLVK